MYYVVAVDVHVVFRVLTLKSASGSQTLTSVNLEKALGSPQTVVPSKQFSKSNLCLNVGIPYVGHTKGWIFL